VKMDRKLTARVDISKAAQAAKVTVGETVEVVIRGKVKSIRGPEEGTYGVVGDKKSEKYMHPGSIEIELKEFKVLEGSDFSGMEDD